MLRFASLTDFKEDSIETVLHSKPFFGHVGSLWSAIRDVSDDMEQRFVIQNQLETDRFICGRAVPGNGSIEISLDVLESCNEPPGFYSVNPTLLGFELPPTIVNYGQSALTTKMDKCNVPCIVKGELVGTMASIAIDGTPWTFTYSMEGSGYYPKLAIDSAAYRQSLFYATTSFKSEIPLSYYFPEIDIQKHPPVSFDESIKAAVFMANNCDPLNKRGKYVSKMMIANEGIPVHSLSTCNHNAEPPPGVDRNIKENVMERYMFYLAFENQDTNDYITEKLWGPLAAGTVPVYMGAPNIKEHQLPPSSVIYTKDFDSPESLAQYLQMVANNRALYEMIYHAWRKQPLPEAFREKYDFTYVHSHCRFCRWAFAKRYGFGWNHTKQNLQEPIIPRKTCIGDKESKKGAAIYDDIVQPVYGFLTHPVVESYSVLDGRKNATMILGNGGMNNVTQKCQLRLADRSIRLERSRITRTVWDHDGVTDLYYSRDCPSVTVAVNSSFSPSTFTNGSERLPKSTVDNSTSEHVESRISVIARLELPFSIGNLTVQRTDRKDNLLHLWIQDGLSRITVLANRVCLGLEINVDSKLVSIPLTDDVLGNRRSPFRLRIIVEDIDTFHKGAEEFNNYFGSRMVEDFFAPIEWRSIDDKISAE